MSFFACKRIGFFIYLFILLLSFSSVAEAQLGGFFPQWEWGARYVASNLFLTPSNDIFGVFYNPANIVNCSDQLGLERINAFDVPISAITMARASKGFYLVLMQSPAGLDFKISTFKLGVPLGFDFNNLQIGFTPKLLFLSITGTDDFDENSFGFSSDLGMNYSINLQHNQQKKIGFGLVVEDFYSIFRGEEAQTPQFRGSFFSEFLTLKSEVGLIVKEQETILYGGGEYNLLEAIVFDLDPLTELNIRGGLRQGGTISGGVGVLMEGFQVDFAYVFSKTGRNFSISTIIHF